MMERITVEAITEMIGCDYNAQLIRKLIITMFPTHEYIPFRSMEDLEGMIYITCADKEWDVWRVLAIHSANINLVDKNGTDYGSCLIIPNTTSADFVDTIQRAIKVKAFL